MKLKQQHPLNSSVEAQMDDSSLIPLMQKCLLSPGELRASLLWRNQTSILNSDSQMKRMTIPGLCHQLWPPFGHIRFPPSPVRNPICNLQPTALVSTGPSKVWPSWRAVDSRPLGRSEALSTTGLSMAISAILGIMSPHHLFTCLIPALSALSCPPLHILLKVPLVTTWFLKKLGREISHNMLCLVSHFLWHSPPPLVHRKFGRGWISPLQVWRDPNSFFPLITLCNSATIPRTLLHLMFFPLVLSSLPPSQCPLTQPSCHWRPQRATQGGLPVGPSLMAPQPGI